MSSPRLSAHAHLLATRPDRRALLALWAVPGIGSRRIERLRQLTGDRPGELLAWTPVRALEAIEAPESVIARLRALPVLELIADEVEARMARAGMAVAYVGDGAYPAHLAQVADAPPLLFFIGHPGPARPRLAMVGTRRPESGFSARARGLAREIAEAGVGIVSGAAEGIDHACHAGALDAGGETLAFVGSALDTMDGARRELLARVLHHGGVFYSELPPGVAANRFTFPRRNRLIAGAADAVLILRAGLRSGSAHTAAAAIAQGRPLWVVPGDDDNAAAMGSNALLREGKAHACHSSEELLAALGVTARRRERVQPVDLSPDAQQTLALLSTAPTVLDDLLARGRMGVSKMIGALVELELCGLAVQRPGRLYERV